MCGFTTEYLDLIYYFFVLFVRCCTTYEYVCVYTCLLLCSVLLCCCCCSSCCLRLLFVIVCRMTKSVPGSLFLIPLFFFSFNYDLFLVYPLAVLSHSRPRFAYYILGNCNYGHGRSQGGRQPAAATCIYCIVRTSGTTEALSYCLLPSFPISSVKCCTSDFRPPPKI